MQRSVGTERAAVFHVIVRPRSTAFSTMSHPRAAAGYINDRRRGMEKRRHVKKACRYRRADELRSTPPGSLKYRCRRGDRERVPGDDDRRRFRPLHCTRPGTRGRVNDEEVRLGFVPLSPRIGHGGTRPSQQPDDLHRFPSCRTRAAGPSGPSRSRKYNLK